MAQNKARDEVDYTPRSARMPNWTKLCRLLWNGKNCLIGQALSYLPIKVDSIVHLLFPLLSLQ